MSHSDLGKAAFAIKDYKTAVDHYSAAIVDDPLHSIHYSNRSLCYLKLEDYTNARDDCLNAISIDPNNTKAWYRHALASISLGDKETAIKDLQQAMTISSDRSIAELLHSIESPRKQTNKTTFHDFIENCEKKKYDKNQIENILNKAEKVLNKRPAVTKVDVDTIRIVGDIHGQFCVIEKIVREHNGPILFNGDLVDRGARGVECFIGIMALISERDDVYINRGNHEDQSINQTFGFETEASSKIGRELFEK
ncbi:Serine/threonine-protein phosphatase [Entamoeba marina]